MDINSFVIGYKKGKASVPTGGGSVELNIAYGDTAPEDTSKLWCKTDEPSAVIISKELEFGEGGAGDNAEVSTLTATIPELMDRMAVGSFGNKIYLAGGRIRVTGSTDIISVFNTVDESITTISTKLPYVVQSAGSAVVGSKLYLLGGQSDNALNSAMNKICYFDMETEEAKTVSATLPKVISSAGCAAVGKKVYLFGGYRYVTNAFEHQTAIYCFDTETNSVEELDAVLPSGMYDMACAAVGTKIYLLGGARVVGTTSSTSVDTILCFDTETSSFVDVSAKLPQPIFGSACISIGTAVYILGGADSTASPARQNTIYRYDTVRDVVSKLGAEFPEARYYAGAGFANGSIYLFGGFTGSFLDDIQRIAIATVALAPDTMQIVPRDDMNIVTLIKGDDVLEIGVDTAYKGNADGVGERVEMALYKDGEWVEIEAGGSLLQEKTVDITENGTVTIVPDAGKEGLTKVTANVNVIGENRLAGYLDGSVTEITAEDFGTATKVDTYRFYYNKKLTSVDIPTSVTEIGAFAFGYCNGLTKITIPENIKTIGSSAFADCLYVTEINFNAISVNDHGMQQRALNNVGKTSGAVVLNVGEKVTKIPAYLFNPNNNKTYSPKITTVNFAENSVCASIGQYAFSYANALPSITLPNSVTSIHAYAFAYATSLTSIVLPNSLTSIGRQAFDSCTGLKNIKIPSGVTRLEIMTFQYCTSMEYYDFTDHTTIPSLASTDVFSAMPTTCEIRVPAALYDSWITKTNWSTYASQIVAV